MRSRSWPSIIGLVVMTTVLLFLRHEFSPLVEPRLLGIWLAFMGANVIGLALAIAAFHVPGWAGARSARFWTGITQVAAITTTGGISASVWILMPVADGDLKMLMIFLYMWFVAMVLMADGGLPAAIGSLVLIASQAIFVLRDGMPYAAALAGFLVMAGVAILAIRRFIWRAADEAAQARALTERTAEALREALALVTAERDAKTRFIASASHDLQQPLHAAALYFDQALTGDRAVRERAAAGVRSALSSTQALIITMLEYLRLEAGAMPVRPAPTALAPVLAAVMLEHGGAARAKGVRLVSVPRELTAMADAQLLKRMLGNLVANAVRHAGGSRILLGARRHGDRLRLWVIDDGAGIAADDLPRVFDDFAQGSDHGPGGRGGFGLGLASVRRAALLLGGAAGLEPGWRRGSAFFIDLPAVPQGAAARPRARRASPAEAACVAA